MIIVLKLNTSDKDIARVEHQRSRNGLILHTVTGDYHQWIWPFGSHCLSRRFRWQMHVQEPYKLNRAFHPEIIMYPVSKSAEQITALIAGPCSVESYSSSWNRKIRQSCRTICGGASNREQACILSGTRTGRLIFCAVKEETDLIVTELITWLGCLQRKSRPDSDRARNMQNFDCSNSLTAGSSNSLKRGQNVNLPRVDHVRRVSCSRNENVTFWTRIFWNLYQKHTGSAEHPVLKKKIHLPVGQYWPAMPRKKHGIAAEPMRDLDQGRRRWRTDNKSNDPECNLTWRLPWNRKYADRQMRLSGTDRRMPRLSETGHFDIRSYFETDIA